jgi:hypothetical protein
VNRRENSNVGRTALMNKRCNDVSKRRGSDVKGNVI